MSTALAFGCEEDAASCDCSWHENMRYAEASKGLTHEDIFDAIDAWLDGAHDGTKCREYRVRRTVLGHIATLYERGLAVSSVHARGSDRALELALEKVGAL